MIDVIDNDHARTLIYDGLAQTDIDMDFHRLLNVDFSNFPPAGIPTVHPPANQWLHDWDSGLQQWTSTQPAFSDLNGYLTVDQMQRINRLSTVLIGVWQASRIDAQYLPTLDQIRPPVANVGFSGFRLTNVGPPVDPNDVVTLAYMDFLLQGLVPKEAVRCATLTTPLFVGQPVIDGVTTVVGDRILVKNAAEARPFENGIWVITASGHWTRPPDADSGPELERAYVAVREGAVNGGTSWVQVNHVVSLSTDPVFFVLFSSTPSISVIAGNGLSKVGNTLNVLGTANRISVNGTVDIDSDYEGQNSITKLGAITEGIWLADVIGSAHGGTGVDNGGYTISLDNVNFAVGRVGGEANLTLLTGTGDTNVLFPGSGTAVLEDYDQVLRNKRIIKRTGKIASAGKPLINTDIMDVFYITGLNENILSMSDNLVGSFTDGQEILIWIKAPTGDTPPRSIAWGIKYDASLDLPLPTEAQNGLWIFHRFTYSIEKGKWVLTALLHNIPA